MDVKIKVVSSQRLISDLLQITGEAPFYIQGKYLEQHIRNPLRTLGSKEPDIVRTGTPRLEAQLQHSV